MGIDNQELLEHFRQDTLGRLYHYDELRNTDFVSFLRIYLEENGSTNKISQRTFIHRNTVLYKVNKIEMLLDMNLDNTFTKTGCFKTPYLMCNCIIIFVRKFIVFYFWN